MVENENSKLPVSSLALMRRTYSDEEIDLIYELAKFHIENGALIKASTLITGLLEVTHTYAPAWLAKCYLQLTEKNYDAATMSARQAVKIDPDSAEAMLFLIACLLTSRDYNAAGTYLGEVKDKIESGAIDDPNQIHFFKAQMARYSAGTLR